MSENKEGWNFLINARKWHYFRKGRSLCGRWLGLGFSHPFEIDNDNSPDNCPTCLKKLRKEKGEKKA